MVLALLDIYEEHRDEAAFLRLRRARLDAMLEGDARHERMLDARLSAHLDALHAGIADAHPVVAPWLTSRDPNERYVALAALLPTARAGDAVARLRAEAVPAALEPAVQAALVAYGAAHGVALLDHWLGEGDLRHQALALRLMARWGDARTEKIARRALRRPGPVVQRAAFAVLAALGVRDMLGSADALLADSKTEGEREDVLASVARIDRDAALGYARSALGAGTSCGTLGPVLCGAAATRADATILEAILAASEAVDASVLVGVVLAGGHAALDPRWARADEARESNALREAAYALLGDALPPRVLGPRASEEPDERAARLAENDALRARMRAVPHGTRGLWGARDASELRTTQARLGPRHRAWAEWVSTA